MGEKGRLRVVIVDDQAIFRNTAREFLTARGYDVVAEAACAATAASSSATMTASRSVMR
jgi:DNA-binding NarL/FixJ family response regulator